MKLLQANAHSIIPEGVTVSVKSRNIRVKGPRGVLERKFNHLNVEMKVVGNRLNVTSFFGNRSERACLRTLCSHVENMIKGVTNGYEYRMRFVYAHFPINANVTDNNSAIEIRNYLGERITRRVKMYDGVKVEMSARQKDEIVLTGNDLEKVSQSAANIWQSARVGGRKDIRKFLDGVYVSERNILGQS